MSKRSDKEEILFRFFYDIANHNGIVDKRYGTFRQGAQENPLYKLNLKTLEERIDAGWNIKDIALRILEAKDLRIKTPYLHQIVPKNVLVGKKEDINLINPKRKYTHPILLEIKHSVYDYETGGLISSGSVKQKESFLFSDLVNYYFDSLNPQKTSRKEVSDILRYALNVGVDFEAILFGIDAWEISEDDKNTREDPWVLVKEYAKLFEKDTNGVDEPPEDLI